MTRWQSRNHCR